MRGKPMPPIKGDETCANCPVNQGREELCYDCFLIKLGKEKIAKELKEKFGI